MYVVGGQLGRWEESVAALQQWRVLIAALQHCLTQFPEVSFFSGQPIWPVLRQALGNTGTGVNYLLASHAIEDSIAGALGLHRDNVLFAGVDPEVEVLQPQWAVKLPCSVAFHPKLYIRFNYEKITCVMGSANLTQRSVKENFETVLIIRINHKSSPFLKHVVYQTLNFFSPFVKKACLLKFLQIIEHKQIARVFSKMPFAYIDNLTIPLIRSLELFAGYGTPLASIVFAPRYPGEGEAITEYFSGISSGGEHILYEPSKCTHIGTPMHAKLFLFEYQNANVAFIGSPNAAISSFTATGRMIVDNGLLVRLKKRKKDESLFGAARRERSKR